jgi:hypothetical protein
MDILAHFLWTMAMYWQHPRRFIAGIIGFLPDIFSFGVLFVERLITGGLQRGPPTGIPEYVYSLYSMTHSIVICAIGMAVLWYVARNWFWLAFGWPVHIIIDIPTHTDRFFPTPLFWPLSDFVVSGISWGTGWFMLLNYGSIVTLYLWLTLKVPRAPQAI